jgi:hypothetical protein
LGLSALCFCRFGSDCCPSRELVLDSVSLLTGGGLAPAEPLDDPEESLDDPEESLDDPEEPPPLELPGAPEEPPPPPPPPPPPEPPVGGAFGFASGIGSGAGDGGAWPAPGSTGKAIITTSPVMRTTSQGRIPGSRISVL